MKTMRLTKTPRVFACALIAIMLLTMPITARGASLTLTAMPAFTLNGKSYSGSALLAGRNTSETTANPNNPNDESTFIIGDKVFSAAKTSITIDGAGGESLVIISNESNPGKVTAVYAEGLEVVDIKARPDYPNKEADISKLIIEYNNLDSNKPLNINLVNTNNFSIETKGDAAVALNAYNTNLSGIQASGSVILNEYDANCFFARGDGDDAGFDNIFGQSISYPGIAENNVSLPADGTYALTPMFISGQPIGDGAANLSGKVYIGAQAGVNTQTSVGARVQMRVKEDIACRGRVIYGIGDYGLAVVALKKGETVWIDETPIVDRKGDIRFYMSQSEIENTEIHIPDDYIEPMGEIENISALTAMQMTKVVNCEIVINGVTSGEKYTTIKGDKIMAYTSTLEDDYIKCVYGDDYSAKSYILIPKTALKQFGSFVKMITLYSTKLKVTPTANSEKTVNIKKGTIVDAFYLGDQISYYQVRYGSYEGYLDSSDLKEYDESASPGEASPSDAPPGEASPGEASPSEASEGEASEGEASPGEASPGEASPSDAPAGEQKSAGARTKMRVTTTTQFSYDYNKFGLPGVDYGDETATIVLEKGTIVWALNYAQGIEAVTCAYSESEDDNNTFPVSVYNLEPVDGYAKKTVTSDNATIHVTPYHASSVMSQVDKGTIVYVDESWTLSSDYYLIRYGKNKGYILKNVLENYDELTDRVSADLVEVLSSELTGDISALKYSGAIGSIAYNGAQASANSLTKMTVTADYTAYIDLGIVNSDAAVNLKAGDTVLAYNNELVNDGENFIKCALPNDNSNGNFMYVPKDKLEFADSGLVMMIVYNCSDWVSMRAEPNSTSERLHKVKLNEIVYMCGETETYYKVRYGSSTGYILKAYLKSFNKDENSVNALMNFMSKLKYVSSDTNVATVDANGIITKRGAGDAQIYVLRGDIVIDAVSVYNRADIEVALNIQTCKWCSQVYGDGLLSRQEYMAIHETKWSDYDTADHYKCQEQQIHTCECLSKGEYYTCVNAHLHPKCPVCKVCLNIEGHNDHSPAKCGIEGHAVCDKLDHSYCDVCYKYKCEGPEREHGNYSCGIIITCKNCKARVDNENAHILACSHYSCAGGNHDKLGCTHYACAGGNHDMLDCKHYACAGGSHAKLGCGHFACESGDHSKLDCNHNICAGGNHGKLDCGHYVCAGGDHAKLEGCGHYECAGGSHGKLDCGHLACAGGDHGRLDCGHWACAGGDHAKLGCGHFACEGGDHGRLGCGHFACMGGDHSRLGCGHFVCGGGEGHNSWHACGAHFMCLTPSAPHNTYAGCGIHFECSTNDGLNHSVCNICGDRICANPGKTHGADFCFPPMACENCSNPITPITYHGLACGHYTCDPDAAGKDHNKCNFCYEFKCLSGNHGLYPCNDEYLNHYYCNPEAAGLDHTYCERCFSYKCFVHNRGRHDEMGRCGKHYVCEMMFESNHTTKCGDCGLYLCAYAAFDGGHTSENCGTLK